MYAIIFVLTSAYTLWFICIIDCNMNTLEYIKKEYPLHWLVWNNDYEELRMALMLQSFDKEKIDPRGRTPLMLAVKLSFLECVKCLLAAKCNANFECQGWSVVQEAVCSGDKDILTSVIEVRDLQRHMERVSHVPKLLQYLLDAPDFYIEMKWEFTSWVPLMSRLCPSDTYKVYKRGANVRIDTTLLGFDNSTWQRGNRSYIFKGLKDTATMIEIDHDSCEVLTEELNSEIGNIVGIPPAVNAIQTRLNTPVMTNNLDMEKISFERNKSGIWGWRSEKVENINGYLCKVYAATNVEFITRTRMDHLNEDQIKTKTSRTPLHSFLGFAEDEHVSESVSGYPDRVNINTQNSEEFASTSSGRITTKNLRPEEYFSDVDLCGRDVGRSKKMNAKIQRFKANLWLSEDYPLRLQEQVLPILDLMSTMASPHVSKLKDFITMQLPSGFPIKIEIPLFHILNACITFGNVFGLTSPIEHVQTIQEDDRITCVVDDRCFDIPMDYVNRDVNVRRQQTLDEEDLLQYAIEQSLAERTERETDKVDIWEALRENGHSSPLNQNEEHQLQRILQESVYQGVRSFSEDDNEEYNGVDAELALALRLSQHDQRQYVLQLQKEQEIIEEVLKLSLEEN